MKKTLTVTVILAALAAALAVYVALVEKKPVPAAKSDWEPTYALEEGGQIDRITLVRDSGTITMELVPNTTILKITEPVTAIAEPIYTEMLVNELLKLKKEKLIELDPPDLGKYQLDKPQGEVIVHYSNGKPETRLLIGKLNYTQDYLFAKLADSPTVFLVGPHIGHYLEAPLSDYRSKALVLHNPADVMSLTIKIDDPALKQKFQGALEPKVVQQRQTDQQPQWTIVNPISENADFRKIKTFFNALSRVSADNVSDVSTKEDLAKFGLDKPRARIILAIKDGSVEEVDFGAGDEDKGVVYARNAALPQVIPLAETNFAILLTSHFRPDTIMESMRLLNLSSISLEFPRAPADNITLKKDQARVFYFADDPETKVTSDHLKWIFNPFMSQTVIYVKHLPPFSPEEYGLAPERLRIRADAGERQVLDVSIGDTVRVMERLFTYVEDHRKNDVVMMPGDLYNTMPLTRDYLKANPEELKIIEKRRGKRNHEK